MPTMRIKRDRRRGALARPLPTNSCSEAADLRITQSKHDGIGDLPSQDYSARGEDVGPPMNPPSNHITTPTTTTTTYK